MDSVTCIQTDLQSRITRFLAFYVGILIIFYMRELPERKVSDGTWKWVKWNTIAQQLLRRNEIQNNLQPTTEIESVKQLETNALNTNIPILVLG